MRRLKKVSRVATNLKNVFFDFVCLLRLCLGRNETIRRLNSVLFFSLTVWIRRGSELYHSATSVAEASAIPERFPSFVHHQRHLSTRTEKQTSRSAWSNRHPNFVSHKRHQIPVARTDCLDTAWLQGMLDMQPVSVCERFHMNFITCFPLDLQP